ncbi:hypothetical protein ABF162_18585 [Vibrio coralliilyticus]|uniref:hypothetical protein n=1 Tax=Vibrio coralliilyticus TaxID=190893 RepID=UPI0005128373|nr:hypothetical protein [Vibrio coralliilyticus]AIS57388.1 hypothetical protein JV59_20440 [Vibrio coralliilyticus]
MELYSNLLKEGHYGVLVVLVAISLVINFPRILEFYHTNKKRKSLLINEALSDPNISETLKDHLREEIETETFSLVHGVSLSHRMLRSIMEINRRVKGSVSFRHILRVAKLQPSVENVDCCSYRVKMNLFDKFFSVYNLVLGVLIFLFGFYLIFLSLSALGTLQNLGYILIGVAFTCMGIFMANDGVKIISVYYVNQALDSYEKSLDDSL